MSRFKPSPSELTWFVPIDIAASLLTLARDLDRGAVDGVARIRSTWAVRRLAELLDDDKRDIASQLLARLDPDGIVPPEPNLVALRTWLQLWFREARWGALSELARAANLHSVDISKLRGGGPLTDAKRERLAAALIAAGAIKPGASQ
jgi:hypothetical protein